MLHASLLETWSTLDLVIVRHDILAERCQQAYLNYHKQQIKNIVTTPLILSLADWIAYGWYKRPSNQNTLSKQLINTTQSLGAWEAIISSKTLNLRTAALAYEAWNFFKQYQIDYLNSSLGDYPEHRKWQVWAENFANQCDSQSKLDFYTGVEALMQPNGISYAPLPKKIGFLGFDSPTPLEQQLFTYLKKQGCLIQFLTIPYSAKPCSIKTITFNDPYEELTTMAHWAYQTLGKNPNQAIVCIIPHFKTRRTQVMTTFQRVYREYFHDTISADYLFSAPLETTTLIGHPSIQTALDIINLNALIPLKTLSHLLRSPYLGDANSEQFGRLQLDRFLRQEGSPFISAFALQRYSAKFNCPALASRLKTWQTQPSPERVCSPTQWVDYWRTRLKAWGWGSTTMLSEEEQYYYAKWSMILQNFCRLDRVLSKLDHTKALNILTDLATHTKVPLQPTKPINSIQLIDLKDVSHWYGEKYWVFNAHQAHYEPNSFNPFIPYTLQRAVKTSLTLSSMLEHLSQQGKPLIVSSTQKLVLPAHKTNFYSQEISISELQLTAYPSIAETMTASITWESFQDQWAPPLLNHEVSIGGSDLIKKQAICPFRAFVDYRLSLKRERLNLSNSAPTRAEKAIYLHSILEKIWKQLKTQKQLNQLSKIELAQLLKDTIHAEIQKHRQHKPYLWQPVFTTIEKERVYELLKKWFEFEKQRPTFSNRAVEYPLDGIIGPLKLSFTIDRIDQLSDGSLLLIDYKTSLQPPTRQHWMGNRPLEPQLPLYLLNIENTAQGITWVHFHPEYGGKFLGLSQEDTNIPGIQPIYTQKPLLTWEALVAQWQSRLEKLAHQFYTGYAAVDPKDGPLSCRHCPYALLCRIGQSNQ